ncbi:MAG: DUF4258 domain-containing protein [Planctomycetes bacterium]|nr:DUF4258 domain-containing protein [Planctomycetota bacterium]
MHLTVQFIHESIRHGTYEISLHADEERLQEGMTVRDIEEALAAAELLEDYPDDPRGHSCLVLGYSSGRPVHCVCGLTRQGRLFLITVYRPSMPKWKDERNRNR